MEQTLQALGAILLKAIPTVVLVLLLHFYFKSMLFGPLEKVLKARAELTEGAREVAERALRNAEEKAASYEAALQQARAQLYREQEETRRCWLEEQAKQIDEARARARAMIREAKEQIAAETAAARHSLVETSAALAEQIASTLLGRRAA